MFTLEDELDELDIELGAARRRLRSVERAPSEGRWTRDGIAWMDAVAACEGVVRRLERQRAGILADIVRRLCDALAGDGGGA